MKKESTIVQFVVARCLSSGTIPNLSGRSMVNFAGDAGTIQTIVGRTKDKTEGNGETALKLYYFVLDTDSLTSNDSISLIPIF